MPDIITREPAVSAVHAAPTPVAPRTAEQTMENVACNAVTSMRSAVDGLFWLEELTKVIAETAGSEGPLNLGRIKILAEVGAYIAFDFGNSLDCSRADFEAGHAAALRSLVKGGAA